MLEIVCAESSVSVVSSCLFSLETLSGLDEPLTCSFVGFHLVSRLDHGFKERVREHERPSEGGKRYCIHYKPTNTYLIVH